MEVPFALARVTLTDLIRLESDVPAGTVPPSETGMSTENRLPNAWEVVLLYHEAKNDEASMVNCEAVSVTEEAGVNCRVRVVMARGVEYPFTVTVKEVAVCAVIWAVKRTGALEGSVRLSVMGLDGVRSNPLVVAKVGVRVMVPATVPV